LGAQADQSSLPEGLDVGHEVALRQERLVNLAEAKRVLEARAQERYAAEQAEYEVKLRTEFGQAIYRLRKCTVEPVIDSLPIQPAGSIIGL